MSRKMLRPVVETNQSVCCPECGQTRTEQLPWPQKAVPETLVSWCLKCAPSPLSIPR